MVDVPTEEGVESALERVRRRLYTSKDTPATQAPSAPTSHAQPEHWQPDAPRRGLSVTAWFFVVALGFFLVAGIAAALILFLGGRSVGNERIGITFETPVLVEGGEVIAFDVIIENENPVEARELTLSVNFPDEAFDPSTMESRGYYSVPLGEIAPGTFVRHSIPVMFFGSEDQKVSIPVALEYQTPNSSAVFRKEASRDLTISSAPLSVRVVSPEDVSSGQSVTVTASVRSNADEPLSDVALKVEYPFGFTPTASSQESVGSNVFVLGNLAPGQEKEISITGVLIGEDADERVFRFSGGVLASTGATTLRTPAYTLATKSVTISRSFIATDLSLNQVREDIVVVPGETISGLISWVNSITSTITDAEVRIALSGDAFNLSSVAVANGLYRSSDRTIVFDESTEPGMRSLSPSETGAGAFTVSIKEADDLSSLRGPSGTLTVSVSGRRSAEGGREEVLAGTISRTVRVMTDLSLEAYGARTLGSFENSGPFPPVAEQETTYTMFWNVTNSVNTVANGTVTAILPPYVRYTGLASPSVISYDDVTRTVSWSLGEVAPGVTREGSFQVALTPSTSQRGSAPVLLEDVRLRGFDRFVQKEVGDDEDPLTTEIRNDPDFHSGDERVQ